MPVSKKDCWDDIAYCYKYNSVDELKDAIVNALGGPICVGTTTVNEHEHEEIIRKALEWWDTPSYMGPVIFAEIFNGVPHKFISEHYGEKVSSAINHSVCTMMNLIVDVWTSYFGHINIDKSIRPLYEKFVNLAFELRSTLDNEDVQNTAYETICNLLIESAPIEYTTSPMDVLYKHDAKLPMHWFMTFGDLSNTKELDSNHGPEMLREIVDCLKPKNNSRSLFTGALNQGCFRWGCSLERLGETDKLDSDIRDVISRDLHPVAKAIAVMYLIVKQDTGLHLESGTIEAVAYAFGTVVLLMADYGYLNNCTDALKNLTISKPEERDRAFSDIAKCVVKFN